MSQYTQIVLLSSMVQMCGGSSSSSEVGESGFSCDDYQLMLDVEVEIGAECSSSADCTQELITGDLSCDPNSIVVNDEFDTSYFHDLYDEAIAAGCSVTLDINEDCSASELVCARSECTWQ